MSDAQRGLIAEAVHVRLGRKEILHGVSLTARNGEILALVGPNGAGKSTLLRTLAGDLTPTSGRVLLDGRPLSAWAPRDLALRRAVLAQRPTLDAAFTVEEVVQLGRHPHRSRAHVDRRIVNACLRDVGLADRARDRWTRLSGGEQQRVALARALAQLAGPVDDPVTLLLDEPTSALDLAWQHRALHLARQLASAGNAVLIVVHDLALAALHADRAALLHDGRLLGVGTPREVLSPQALTRAYGVQAHWVDIPELGAVPVVLGAPLPTPDTPAEVA